MLLVTDFDEITELTFKLKELREANDRLEQTVNRLKTIFGEDGGGGITMGQLCFDLSGQDEMGIGKSTLIRKSGEPMQNHLTG